MAYINRQRTIVEQCEISDEDLAAIHKAKKGGEAWEVADDIMSGKSHGRINIIDGWLDTIIVRTDNDKTVLEWTQEV